MNIPHHDAATSQYPTKLAYYPTRVAYKLRFAAPTKDIFKRNYSIVMGYYLRLLLTLTNQEAEWLPIG